MKELQQLQEFENFIQSINETLMPISDEISEKLDFLNGFLDDKQSYEFKEITMEEISKE